MKYATLFATFKSETNKSGMLYSICNGSISHFQTFKKCFRFSTTCTHIYAKYDIVYSETNYILERLRLSYVTERTGSFTREICHQSERISISKYWSRNSAFLTKSNLKFEIWLNLY